MIITLTGADFSKNNIGVLNTWRIARTLVGVTTDSTVSSVNKGASYSATFTVTTGYELSSWSITMGGADASSYVVWKDGTGATLSTDDSDFKTNAASAVVTIGAVTGNVSISMIAATSESDEPAVTQLDTPTIDVTKQ